MRILQISDFHLDKNDRQDSIKHIVEPLIKTLQDDKIKPIDLIIFTGDFVNIGGKDYKDLDEAFLDCEEVFIKPLLQVTGLNKDRFFFVPGNHDINRSADTKITESGLQVELSSEEKINKYLLFPEGNRRIDAFKRFEGNFYSGFDCCINKTDFQSTYKININHTEIGIACLNSSWRCYDSDKDKGIILIGEKQIIDSLNDIKDCNIKIALSHHHFEWLNEFDKDVVEVLLKQDFNMYFTGHTHSTKVSYTQDPDGKMFSFCSSGTLANNIRKPDRKFENGFSIIDYDELAGTLNVMFYKGNYPKDKFVVNTSLGDGGVWSTNIPLDDEIEKIVYEQKIIKEINEEAIPMINSHLLSYATDTTAPKKLNEIFVMPNIIFKEQFDAEKKTKSVASLDEIINCTKNYIFFGTKESGKTILLDRILVETLNTNKNHHQIPVIINFQDLKDNVTKLIREFWNKSISDTKRIFNDYKILLLIDNLTFEPEDEYKLKALRHFLEENPNVRFLATYQQFYEEEYPLNLELVSLFDFEYLTLKQFKTKQIKELIKKWFPRSDKYDTPRKLETLSNAFLSLNLPKTPFAISMFLWIIEKQENFKPINNSILIENFIERLLKKHDAVENLRGTFGYDNKIWIISYIAHEMLERDNLNYSLSYSDFVGIVEKYLKNKKFEDFSTNKIVEVLLGSGIFINELNDIRFRFTCFFEFFLMKRMERDSKFKAFVLDEKNYLKFVNEIDYFTGINRGETDLLKLVVSRLEEVYSGVEEWIDGNRKEMGYSNYDGYFIDNNEKGEEKPSIASQLHEEKVMTFLPENKPTEEDLEVIEDDKFESRPAEKGIAKKEVGFKIKDLSKLLILSLKILKNSEEIHDDDNPNLKLDNYSIILNKSILFVILQKAILQLLTEDDSKGVPKEKIEKFKEMSQFLPLIHQMFLFDHVGTQKLTSVIRDKINNDILDTSGAISDFEKALSVFLYADIRGKDYNTIISKFIGDVKTKFTEDMIFFKLVTYFFHRSKDEKTDNLYLNIIADLIIKSKGYRKNRKGSIIQDYRKKKLITVGKDGKRL